jgi:hypothetical protein
MKVDPPDLPPLWTEPPPLGHNGGPAMGCRASGRPSIATPAIRDRILELLAEGVPLRVICRTAGMPSRSTVFNWRRDDPEFGRHFDLMQREGYIGLAERVMEEVEAVMEKRGAEMARAVFNWRQQELARMNPRFFGNRGLGR